MPEIGESELRKQLRAGEFKNAYLIYGDESYLKEYYVSLIQKKLVDKSFEAFNLHTFDGKDVLLDDILKDAQMLPMMSEYNLVIVRDYPIDKEKADLELLEEYLADCPESTVFVMWFDSLVLDSKSAKFKRLSKAFSKAGVVANLHKRTDSEIASLLVNGAKKRGSSLDVVNAKYLISVSGNDLQTLLNELDKLCAFAQGTPITREIIDNMATKCFQARIYDLSKCIVAGNSYKAFDVLNSLFEMKEKPIMILSAISGVYVDMYRVKCAKAAGYSYDDVAKHFNYKRREFALKNASRDCASMSISRLRASLDAIMQTDIKLKSTAADERILLEELTVKLLMGS